MIDIRQHFLEFLLEHNALDAYIANKHTKSSIPKSQKSLDIINDSFTWKFSSEGYDYWEHLRNLYMPLNISIDYVPHRLDDIMKYCEEYKIINDSYEYW